MIPLFATISSGKNRRRAFTLIELLIVVAIIATLIGILIPALSAARREARTAACSARLRELCTGMLMYADNYDGRLMPLAYTSVETVGAGPPVYWWGTNDTAGVDHERGFLWPYLKSPLGGSTVFECPQQPWGSYRPQGAAKSVTSTYGYNGYYLSPEHSTSYSFSIGHMAWQMLSTIKEPSSVFAFADTLIDLGGSQPRNNALLDPPWLYSGGMWNENPSPTTVFRHDRRTIAAHLDGHVDGYVYEPAWLKSTRYFIGTVGLDNGPHYIPNWRDWREPP